MNPALALAPFLLSAALWSQGQVLVVDDDGGPGIDFTELQPAIDAAQDGDVILVKDGVYGACALDDRALTVCAEAGADASVESVAVSHLAAGRVARVQGVRSILRTPLTPCVLADNAGQVWIEDCSFEPTTELVYPGAFTGSEAVVVSGCAAVVLVNVSATGQTVPSGFAGFGGYYTGPGPGLALFDSTASVFGCTLVGGVGTTFLTFPSFYSYPTSGGSGVRVNGPSVLRLSTSIATGGLGGPTVEGAIGCYYGAGGIGLSAECDQGCPEIVLQACTILGGRGGPKSYLGSCGEDGPVGASLSLPEGSLLVELSDPGLKLEAPSPVRENAVLDIVLRGPPQALAFLGISASPDLIFAPSLGAPLVLAAPIFALQLGVIPASGELSLGLPLLEMPAGFESMIFHGQAAYLDAQNAVVLGQPGVVVLLDAAF